MKKKLAKWQASKKQLLMLLMYIGIILTLISVILVNINIITLNPKTYKNETISNYMAFKSELIGFTEIEQLHMNDVRNLITNLKMFTYLSLAVLLLVIVLLLDDYRKIGLMLVIGAGLSILFAIALGVVSYFNFDWLFYKFHTIAFSNNYWLLNKHSTLIQLFPQNYFYMLLKKLLIGIGITSIILICIGFLIKHNPTKHLPGGG